MLNFLEVLKVFEREVNRLPTWFTFTVVGVYSAVIGSFLNMLIYRLPRDMDIIFQPSHCPKCKQHLMWWHNIPIISYIILGGRCYYCGARIPLRYFIVEVLMVILGIWLCSLFGLRGEFFRWWIFTAIAIAISFTDYELYIIPDELNIAIAVLGVIYWYLRGEIAEAIITGIIGALIFLAIYYFGRLAFKKEAMGLGDVKLAFALGVFLGKWELAIIAMLIAFLSGAVIGSSVALPIWYKRKFTVYGKLQSSDPLRWYSLLGYDYIIRLIADYLFYAFEDISKTFYVPFGPFMLFGALLAGIYGYQLIELYYRALFPLYF